jgi:hypothetical protein
MEQPRQNHHISYGVEHSSVLLLGRGQGLSDVGTLTSQHMRPCAPDPASGPGERIRQADPKTGFRPAGQSR